MVNKINKRAEKHLKNLARFLGAFNKPYAGLGVCFSLKELLETKGLPQDEINFLLNKLMVEIDRLLEELGIDRQDYSKEDYKDIFDWWQNIHEYVE